MNDRHKYRIPMFTDKGHFIGYQYVSLGDIIEVMPCGYNGDPEQCTGLRDRNGKLIYDGDIIKIVDGDFIPIGVKLEVCYGWISWQLRELVQGRYLDFYCGGSTFEIIGNIHEQEVSE